jgi:ubiquinone/menaquinone biosynthesis C-methylase UbiE
MTNKIDPKDVYTQEVGNLYDEADISCNPMSKDKLLDFAVEHGVRKESLVLDIGCANGGVSRELLEKTGCKIEGVELLDLLVDMGNEENDELGLADRFRIQQGSITSIPFEDNTFDFIFANDVFGMVEDIDTALTECRRVLKPGGKMLVYLSLRTERLPKEEANELSATQGGPSILREESDTEAALKSGFKLIDKIDIGSQFTQNSTEKSKEMSEATKGLLRVARLLTWPEKYIQKYGEQRYRTVLAGSHWSVYILLGKLKPTVFIVQKEG